MFAVKNSAYSPFIALIFQEVHFNNKKFPQAVNEDPKKEIHKVTYHNLVISNFTPFIIIK